MRERIESKHVTKEIKSQMPVISPEIIKERGCTFCPYYLCKMESIYEESDGKSGGKVPGSETDLYNSFKDVCR